VGKFDFGAAQEKAEKDGLISGGYLKIHEGDNRIRIVSEALAHPSTFKGQDGTTKPTFKWLVLVIDRSDGQVKPFFMAPTIARMIADLQKSDDWAFESVPMPYDLTIRAKNAGKMTVEYSVIPSPKMTPITGDEQVAIDAAKPIRDVQAAIYEKGGRPEDKTHVPGFDPDDVPA
jgi:hypothetical protein